MNPTFNSPILHSYTGHCIDVLNPTPDCIEITDIAHALSMQCRFGGRIEKFYSVAEHSVRVSHVCDPEHALWGLLHDASEAYIVDIPRPVKYLPEMRGYLELEERFMKAVIDKYNLGQYEMPLSVKKADDILLLTEKASLLPETEVWGNWDESIIALDEVIEPLSPKEAKEWFLERFMELYNS